MPNDLTIPAVAANAFGNNTAVKTKAVAVEPTTVADPAPATPLTVNPVIRLDQSLGLVVIEFRNASGAITTSIPSQQQLEAYQRWDDTRLGPMPPGCTDTAPSTPPAAATQTPAVSRQDTTKPDKTDPG
ncbi:MAG: hypothetical protein WA864_00115 [Acetobacteraceae bacterium]